jgi:secernin
MCDTMAAVGAATGSGGVLFAKNSDREYNEAQYLEMIPASRHAADSRVRLTYKEIEQVPRTHSVLISKPHWIWGAEIGANEHGLVIGNEALFSRIEASLTPGIIGMDYLRLALERAASVDEGILVITTLLREHGQSGRCGFKRELGYHNSFILADPHGAKVLETVDREWVVASINDYYAISNAMTIGSEFHASSITLKARAIDAHIHEGEATFAFNSVYEDAPKVASGRFRRERVMTLLDDREGLLEPIDLFKVLRDHEEGVPSPGRPSGPRICSHTRENPLGQTTASWVASLQPGNAVHWVTGTSAPCGGLFKPVLIETGLPLHGARPGDDVDSGSLWWSHEQLRRYLDTNDELTRRAFTANRDLLEARFLEQMTECPKIDDTESKAEASRIVEAIWQEALEFEKQWCAIASVTVASSGMAEAT